MLDIPNLAHRAFVMLGVFASCELSARLGLDPIVAVEPRGLGHAMTLGLLREGCNVVAVGHIEAARTG